MLNKFILPLGVLVLALLLTPRKIEAYGAAHVGYTHVGPNGVYHTGATVASGPGGVSASSHTSAYGAGGATYQRGGAVTAGPGGAGGYQYHYGYANGVSGGAARYGYVR